jgi:hypothetical protein
VKAVTHPSKSRRDGKPPAAALIMVAAAGILVTVVRAGHELPVYPSYYPHEIAIETMTPERAADLLRENKLHAYLGPRPLFPGDTPASIRAVESLGSFIIVRLNPASAAARDGSSACAMTETILRGMAGSGGFVFHPYPVTPLHGDYLYFADLAAAAKARLLSAASSRPATPNPNIKADGAQNNLVPAAWIAPGPEWDAAVEEVDAAGLLAGSMRSVNGWIGPPWLKAGWFHAERILADALDADVKGRAEAALARLEASQEHDSVERINLERELVTALAGNCRKVVAGYTVRRQYFSAEFTEGIENIGFDSIAGLNSPMFIRTVKLKDFPWNGWLTLGIDKAPQAAWNPIAGFDDPFGHLLWSAVGDPALLPQPYDSGWMLNRISDVQPNSGR